MSRPIATISPTCAAYCRGSGWRLDAAQRRLGVHHTAGNPGGVLELSDLQRPGLVFVNRRARLGDTRLVRYVRYSEQDLRYPQGYAGVTMNAPTYSEVARTVAEGQADAGFGLQTAAVAFGLDFIPLVSERYDLVIPEATYDLFRLCSNWQAGWRNAPPPGNCRAGGV